jgi:hypothetical protein
MVAPAGSATDLVLPLGVEPVAELDGRRRRGAKPQAPSARTGEAGPLGKNAKTAAIAGQDRLEKARAARSVRMRARRQLSPLTTLRRVARCGRVSVVDGGEVHLRVTEGTVRQAGLGGLETCGSVWACPVCSAKISARRATELEHLVRWNADRGGSIALLTLTMRHNRGHRLTTLRKALQGAWRHVTASRAWKESRATYGRDGYVRAIEATHGEHGWHLHVHALLIFDGPLSHELASVLADELWDLWRDGLEAQGMTALREHGLDLRVGGDAVDGMGKYLSKLTFEAAGGRWKQARGGSRTPYQVLDEFLAWGNADDWDIWEEWEQGSHGMRQLVWSRGLKDRAQVEDVTDDKIAAEDVGGETIAILPARTWAQVWHHAEDLLTAAEQGGRATAYAWLDARHLPFDPR